jgi:ribosomal protein S18 acetylase RimI-like enzyme
MNVMAFDNGQDFETQRAVTALYEGVFPIAPVLHGVLTGSMGMWMYLVRSDAGELMGAGILKSPEAVIPIGPDIRPIAWVVSDMVTAQQFRRRGVARLLLRHMEGIAYRNGGRVLYLYTETGNHGAIALYQRGRFIRLDDQAKSAVFVKLLGEQHGTN